MVFAIYLRHGDIWPLAILKYVGDVSPLQCIVTSIKIEQREKDFDIILGWLSIFQQLESSCALLPAFILSLNMLPTAWFC